MGINKDVLDIMLDLLIALSVLVILYYNTRQLFFKAENNNISEEESNSVKNTIIDREANTFSLDEIKIALKEKLLKEFNIEINTIEFYKIGETLYNNKLHVWLKIDTILEINKKLLIKNIETLHPAVGLSIEKEDLIKASERNTK